MNSVNSVDPHPVGNELVNKKTNILFLAELTIRWEERTSGEGSGPLCLMWLTRQVRGEVRAW